MVSWTQNISQCTISYVSWIPELLDKLFIYCFTLNCRINISLIVFLSTYFAWLVEYPRWSGEWYYLALNKTCGFGLLSTNIKFDFIRFGKALWVFSQWITMSGNRGFICVYLWNLIFFDVNSMYWILRARSSHIKPIYTYFVSQEFSFPDIITIIGRFIQHLLQSIQIYHAINAPYTFRKKYHTNYKSRL